MSRFYTGNPLGSGSPLDLDDNAKNFDLAAISPKDTFLDRFKQSRLTYAGMESEFQSAQNSRELRFNDFIASSGYQFVGDYAPGIEITEYNQLIRDSNGEFWRVSGQVDLPYVTTGAGIPEDDALVPAGDAVLRQDLSDPDKGAAMVARGVVAVDSIADLLALPEGQKKEGLRYLVKGYHAGSDAGGGEFYYDPDDTTTPADGGTVFEVIGGGRFKRIPVGSSVSRDVFAEYNVQPIDEEIVIYCDPDNGDDSASGGLNAPLKTITAALKRVPFFIDNVRVEINLYSAPQARGASSVFYDEDVV